jgi:hypothetical protein
MKITLIVAAACFTLVGCATTRPMSPEVEQTLPGKSVTQIKFGKPDFMAATPAKAMFGMLGAVAMIAAGNEIVEEGKVEDPAPYIGQELMKRMQEKYKTMPLTQTALQANTSDLDELAEAYPQSDLLLDVRTTNWQMTYFPLNWSQYRIAYGVRARLVNLKTQEVLAEGSCERFPEDDTNAPSYDEMVENQASRLKHELRLAANICVEKLKAEIFKM